MSDSGANTLATFQAECADCGARFAVPSLGESTYGEFIFFGERGDIHARLDAIDNPVWMLAAQLFRDDQASILRALAAVADPVRGQRLSASHVCPSCQSSHWASWFGARVGTTEVTEVTFNAFNQLSEAEKISRLRATSLAAAEDRDPPSQPCPPQDLPLRRGTMKYTVQFGLLSVAAVIAAFTRRSSPAALAIFIWIGTALGIVAVAYGLGRPLLLMKRADGSRSVFAWFLLWPYFALAYLSFWVHKLFARGSVGIAEIVPGLWFARRPTRSEAHANVSRWSGVLDLTAEFAKAPILTDGYRCLPILDATAPTEAQLRDGAEWISERLKHGAVLVHCAPGHGRTGSMVIAWLLLNGRVQSVDEGIAKLKALRGGVGLSHRQIASVTHVVTKPATRRGG